MAGHVNTKCRSSPTSPKKHGGRPVADGARLGGDKHPKATHDTPYETVRRGEASTDQRVAATQTSYGAYTLGEQTIANAYKAGPHKMDMYGDTPLDPAKPCQPNARHISYYMRAHGGRVD
jgi:hypothetical protein